jgi:rRNA maturation protein Rpf1
MNNTGIIQIKSADAKEHLRITLDEVRAQNKILNLILKKKEDTELYISNKLEQFAKDAEYNAVVIQDTNARLKKIDTREREIILKSVELDEKKEKIKSELDSLKAKILDVSTKFNQNLSIYNDEITSKKEDLKELDVSIYSLSKKESKLIELVDELSSKLDLLEKTIYEKKEEKEKILNDLSSFVTQSKKEKDKINKEIQEERNKITNPMKLLAESDLYIKKKQRNLDILIDRFRKEFKKLHPTLEPKI